MQHVELEKLPPLLQEKVSEISRQDHKAQGKKLHRLVADKTAAQQGLQKVRAERTQYTQAWDNYVESMLTTWDKQSAEGLGFRV